MVGGGEWTPHGQFEKLTRNEGVTSPLPSGAADLAWVEEDSPLADLTLGSDSPPMAKSDNRQLIWHGGEDSPIADLTYDS